MRKYYAVTRGRHGNKIYNSWEEANKEIMGVRNAKCKSFENLKEAKKFLNTKRKRKTKEKPVKSMSLQELRDKTGMSKGERCVRNYLKSEKIKFATQYDTFKCYNPDTNQILPYDFELIDYKILIEIQGEQHLKFPNGFHSTTEEFDDQRRRDRFKKAMAIKNGYKLVELFPKDIDSGKYREIILSTIKKQINTF